MSTSTRHVVQFSAPREVEVVEEPTPAPEADEVSVRTTLSAISPGTERLVYTDQVPDEVDADSTLQSLSGHLDFPLRYGYATVGVVDRIGQGVAESWRGRRVFSFQSHVSSFVASPSDLIPIPDDVRAEDAVLIPNVETAVNLLMDGRPKIGERVVVFGQGIVGLLTTTILSTYPLEALFTVEPRSERRARSEEEGADRSVPPSKIGVLQEALDIDSEAIPEAEIHDEGADLSYELSGVRSAIDAAVSVTGFNGRIIIGSWYGGDSSVTELGTRFHRSRIQIQSSQVSTIDPRHRGRWTKDRRMGVVLRMLKEVRPGRLITHEYRLQDADKAYEDLADDGQDILQPVFQYPPS